MFELLLSGFYIGSIHIFTSPDHLAALVPLSLMDAKNSWKVGLLWSIGHLIGLTILGVLLYYFKSLINIDFFAHYGILYIAVLLILIGVWVIYKSKKININLTNKEHRNLSRISIGTGIIHGFAGFSHIYSLAPTISMKDIEFYNYFGGFAFGSVFTVFIFTYLICFIPERITKNKHFFRTVSKWSGLLAIGFGVILLFYFYSGGEHILGHQHHH